MELFSKSTRNSLQILEQKINENIVNENLIGINIHTKHMNIHDLVTPDIVEVFDDSVVILSDWFTFQIKNILCNVEYDEEENSIRIYDEDLEINIDFCAGC